MPKKGKGHSSKKRHGIGVPAQGVGKKKDERKKKPPKVEQPPCPGCGKQLRYYQMYSETGKRGVTMLYCPCQA